MPAAVLITGGSRRIGKAIARGMAQDGYTVLLHYHHSEEAARETAKQMEASGVVCHMLKASLSNASQVQTLIEQAFQIEPQCNLLVNNAAAFEAGSLMETTGALLERSWQVNLKAPLLLMQGFSRLCRTEGSIVNLLDTRITQNSSTHFAYSMSKKILFESTKMAALELAPRIRVNGLCPGLILPPEGEGSRFLETKCKELPLQRYGNVEDVVRAVRFFRDTNFVTGDCLFLDGGEHLGKVHQYKKDDVDSH